MKNILISLFLLYLLQGISFASQFGGMDAGSLNSQYMKDLRIHEAVTRAKNKSAIINTQKAETKKEEEINIKSIVFVNNNVIPSQTLISLVQDKINQPLNAENLAAIRKTIMKYYQSLGYYSALPTIVSQNSEGEIVIQIEEGSKNSITIQE